MIVPVDSDSCRERARFVCYEKKSSGGTSRICGEYTQSDSDASRNSETSTRREDELTAELICPIQNRNSLFSVRPLSLVSRATSACSGSLLVLDRLRGDRRAIE